VFDDVPRSYRLDLVSSTEFSNGTVGCSTAGTAKPAADIHDEWQPGQRHYVSERSMAQLKPTSDTGGIAAIDSGG
jgi:hypothetical protein